MKSIHGLTYGLVCAILCVGAASAAEPSPFKVLTPEEKSSDEGLSFCLTFDDYSCNPLSAGGNRLPRTGKEINLLLRGDLGYDGKPAYRQEPGEELVFESAGNVDPKQGTLLLWLNPENYDPATLRGAGFSNLLLLKCFFSDGKNHQAVVLDLTLSGAEESGLRMRWQSDVPPNGWGLNPSAPISLQNIKQGKWHQIVGTWDSREIKIYLYGELVGQNEINPEKSRRALAIQAAPNRSSIQIRGGGKQPDLAKEIHTAIDDVKIFNRVLSPAEIKLQYQKTLAPASPDAPPPSPVEVELNGVDDGKGDLNRVEVVLDISVLRQRWQAAKANTDATVKYEIAGPSGFRQEGQWPSGGKNVLTQIVGGIKEKGEYVFTFRIPDGDQKELVVTRKLVKPDTSWHRNLLGRDDSVPSPWTMLRIDDKNSITLWNRVYKFTDGPFPNEILCGGRQLLDSPPQLVVETAGGVKPLKSKITGKTVKFASIVFNGQFTGDGFTGNFKTTVEFDGLIKTELVVKDQPEVKSMRLEWRVKPEFAKYLMLPHVSPETDPEIFKSAYFSYDSPQLLWLVSELGGFCWAPQNDANWVYKEDEDVLGVNKKTGRCAVRLITSPVKLPPEVDYVFLFTATPTRPLWAKRRTYRLCGSQPFEPTIPPGGMGFQTLCDFIPSDADFKWLKDAKYGMLWPRKLFFYGVGAFMTEQCDVANYFKKYWNRPGGYQYMMTDWNEGKTINTPSLSSCLNHTSKADYLVNNINLLMNSPYLKYIDGAYYDCAGICKCNNELHGCRFADKFGRMSTDTNLLELRELIKRSLDVFHQHDRWLGLHSQWRYNPIAHGLGDFWMPGEQLRGRIEANGTRGAYFDKKILPDQVLRSEYNDRIIGTGVEALVYASPAKDDDASAMATRLMLEDISFWGWWGRAHVIPKTWDAFEKYGLDTAWCYRYHEQQTVKTSSPDVVVTYYQCPLERYLLIVGNTSKSEREATVDLSRLKPGDYEVVDECDHTNLPVADGKLKLKIPPYNFKLIGLML